MVLLGKEGYYGKRLMRLRAIWLWSAVLALLCTLISWPGIWYSDSYVRVDTGNAILSTVIQTLKGHRQPLETGNVFTVIPSFFIALSLALSGQVALFTFVQAFSFFAAVFLLIRELNPEGHRALCVLFACFPLIYGMSVYLEAGIGCVVGLIALILLFRRTGEPKTRGDRILEFVLVAFFSFVAVGYRANAVSVLPVLIYYLLRLRAKKGRKAVMLLALAAGMLMTRVLPWVFDIHSLSVTSTGFIWEMITTIQRMAPEAQEKYADYLDEIGGEGATRAVLAIATEDTAESFMNGEELGIEKMSAPGVTGLVLRKYVQLMFEKPAEWLSVKRDMAMKTLGIGWKLDNAEYDYNRWGLMEKYGYQDSLQRRAFYQSCMTASTALGFLTLRPWILFLISGALTLAEYLRKSRHRRLEGLIFWVAAFYYLVYVLDPIYFQFRYFYPSFLLLMLLDASILWRWGRTLIQGIRKGRKTAETGE